MSLGRRAAIGAAGLAAAAALAAAGFALAGAPLPLAALAGSGVTLLVLAFGSIAIKAAGEGHPEAAVALALAVAAALGGLALATAAGPEATAVLAVLGGAVFAGAVATGAGVLRASRTGLYAGIAPDAGARLHLALVAPAALAAAIAGLLLTPAAADGGAPQGHALATLAQGLAGGPFDATLLLLGIGFGLAADLATRRGLALALGLFLPLATVLPILAGALAREGWERRRAGLPAEGRAARRFGATLVATGLVAGEALALVALAPFT